MRTLKIDRSETEFPYEYECPNCESFEFIFTSQKVTQPPWECETCGELYIPSSDTVRKPTELTIRLMRGHTARQITCDNCDETFSREVLEKSLKQLIEREDSSIENHLLYQIDRPQELAYWNCPECGEPEDFLSNNRPRR